VRILTPVLVLVLLTVASTSAAQPYTFTMIAATSEDGFSDFDREPSLNSGGTVVFAGTLHSGVRGIFTGDGGGASTVVDDRGSLTSFVAPAISRAGAVAFRGYVDTGGSGIFVGAAGGGPVRVLAQTGPCFPDFAFLGGPAALSQGDFIAFVGSQWALPGSCNGNSVLRILVGPITAPVLGTYVQGIGLPLGSPSVNDTGSIVFSEGSGLSTESGSLRRRVAEQGATFSGFGSPPSINDAGTIAFQAFLTAGGEAILIEDQGAFTTIADTSGSFESLAGPAVNNHGTVAFQAQLDGGGVGIFTGPDPQLDRVIGTGDTLLGAAVYSVSFFRGLNDAGQIVFWASLSDGRQGVFRANPTTLADLRVSTISAPAKTSAGSTITVKDTTKNQGAGPADTSTTQWSLSTTATAGPGAVVLASRSVPALAAGALSTKATVVTIPGDTVPGKYFLIAAADTGRMVAETDDTNNEKGKAIVIGPDLRVTALAAPSSVTAGATLTITDQTKNAGGAAAGASTVQFYLSKNRKLEMGAAGDVLLGSRAVPELAPGASSPGSTPVTIPTGTAAGTYFIIAIADPDGDVAEAIESNNTKVTAITIAP
jgi:hypothetical protein